jgi:hypothetical protein
MGYSSSWRAISLYLRWNKNCVMTFGFALQGKEIRSECDNGNSISAIFRRSSSDGGSQDLINENCRLVVK